MHVLQLHIKDFGGLRSRNHDKSSYKYDKRLYPFYILLTIRTKLMISV